MGTSSKAIRSGYVEVASHSRKHLSPSYYYLSEIKCSRNDIIKNLDLPYLFRKNQKEYVYAYILPYGSYDDGTDYAVGDAKYLKTRGVLAGIYDFSLWDKNIYKRTDLAYEVGYHGEKDPVKLKKTFDATVQNHKVYHFYIHPNDFNNSDWDSCLPFKLYQ